MTTASITSRGIDPPDDEVVAVARGIATACAGDSGLTDVQAALLRAMTRAVTGVDVDYSVLEPLGSSELAAEIADRPLDYRHRIVQHMVLGELVLTPLPPAVAARVAEYASALGVEDEFIGVARHYANGALGLAWVELQREGFLNEWDESDSIPLHSKAAVLADPFVWGDRDPELEARWNAFGDLPEGTLGRAVHDMYRTRGFCVPGSLGAASAYLAQHDFVHVLADYGTTLEGELEVFGFVGRADPDPKGFAWLATMIGLFETGYIHAQGPFEMNVQRRHLRTEGMYDRLGDAIRRGKLVSESYGIDLFEVDYHDLAHRDIDEVRTIVHMPPKADQAIESGSVGVDHPDGISEYQREAGRRLMADSG